MSQTYTPQPAAAEGHQHYLLAARLTGPAERPAGALNDPCRAGGMSFAATGVTP